MSDNDNVSDLPWWEEMYEHLRADLNLTNDREYASEVARMMWNER